MFFWERRIVHFDISCGQDLQPLQLLLTLWLEQPAALDALVLAGHQVRDLEVAVARLEEARDAPRVLRRRLARQPPVFVPLAQRREDARHARVGALEGRGGRAFAFAVRAGVGGWEGGAEGGAEDEAGDDKGVEDWDMLDVIAIWMQGTYRG